MDVRRTCEQACYFPQEGTVRAGDEVALNLGGLSVSTPVKTIEMIEAERTEAAIQSVQHRSESPDPLLRFQETTT